MTITIIVAVAENGIIGKDNRLIWRLPDDIKFFKEKTEGHCVITGRKNYESIPDKFRPLPLRTNIVVTRQAGYKAPGAEVVTSIEMAVELARSRGEKDCFIIGGGEIYRQFLPIANKILLTRVHASPEGDTSFNFNPSGWKLSWEEKHPADEKHQFAFTFQEWCKL